MLGQYGTVLTERVASKNLAAYGQTDLSDIEIYKKDMTWLSEAGIVVAEVANSSLGVGYEIARAESMGKKVICLYREQEGKRLSDMLTGSPHVMIVTYVEVNELAGAFKKVFQSAYHQLPQRSHPQDCTDKHGASTEAFPNLLLVA